MKTTVGAGVMFNWIRKFLLAAACTVACAVVYGVVAYDVGMASTQSESQVVVGLTSISLQEGEAFIAVDDSGNIELRQATDGILLAKRTLKGLTIESVYAPDFAKGMVYVIGHSVAGPYDLDNDHLRLLTLDGRTLEVQSDIALEISAYCSSYFSGERLLSICPVYSDQRRERSVFRFVDLTQAGSREVEEYAFPEDVVSAHSIMHLVGDEMVAAVRSVKPGSTESQYELYFFNTSSDEAMPRIAVDFSGSERIQCMVSDNGEQVVALSSRTAYIVDVKTKQLIRQIQWDNKKWGRGAATFDDVIVCSDSAVHVLDSLTGKSIITLADDNSSRWERTKEELIAQHGHLSFGPLLELARLCFYGVVKTDEALIAVTGDGVYYIWSTPNGALSTEVDPIVVEMNR